MGDQNPEGDLSRRRLRPDLAQPVSGFYVALPPVESPTGATIADITKLLRRRVSWLFIAAGLGALSGLVAFFVMSPVYRAEVLSATTSDQADSGLLSTLTGQFGGLAALGGIQLGAQDNAAAEAVAVLHSRQFLGEFIQRRDLLPVLFSSQWSEAQNDWRSQDSTDHPTMQQAIERFLEKIMTVEVNDSRFFVTVRIDWYDRVVAAEWANDLVAGVNTTMRERAVLEAQESIDYLKRELAGTEVLAIQQSLNLLVEEQMRRAMLANTRVEFVLRVIDPAIAPDEDAYVSPSWPLLVIGGLLFGLLTAAALVVWLSKELWQADLQGIEPSPNTG